MSTQHPMDRQHRRNPPRGPETAQSPAGGPGHLDHRISAGRGAWLTVAVREVVVRLSNRAFLVSTAATLLILVGTMAFSAFLSGRDQQTTVAASGDQAVHILDRLAASGGNDTSGSDTSGKATGAASGTGGESLEIVRTDSADQARARVTDGTADFALYQQDGQWQLASEDGDSSATAQRIVAAVAQTVQAQNARQQGVDLARLQQHTQTQLVALDADEGQAQAKVLGYVFAMIFYMAVLTFGMAIATSVLEEKQNRIVEIIATAIPVTQLLAGKLVGNMALAFGQLLLIAAAGLIGMNLFDVGMDFGWVLGGVGWFVVFFVLGFAIMAAVWAAVGAMASRTEDMNASTAPITILLVVVLFAGLSATGTVQQVLSYVPVFSSVIMPMRLVQGDAAWWQALLAAGLDVVAVVLVLRWGSSVYRRAVMRTGEPIKWGQVLRGRL